MERVADAYFDLISGLLRKIGVLKRDTKQPFASVANEQTKIVSQTIRAGK